MYNNTKFGSSWLKYFQTTQTFRLWACTNNNLLLIKMEITVNPHISFCMCINFIIRRNIVQREQFETVRPFVQSTRLWAFNYAKDTDTATHMDTELTEFDVQLKTVCFDSVWELTNTKVLFLPQPNTHHVITQPTLWPRMFTNKRNNPNFVYTDLKTVILPWRKCKLGRCQ